ncbi:MAG TPA: fumarylacetoacetate hydrolase family protein [Blastocatellia bacterium]|nr:fumarylacetoacetate hydrolase family protein [Blastocatellia bacterium]
MFRLYNTTDGIIVEDGDGGFRSIRGDWDQLMRDDLSEWLSGTIGSLPADDRPEASALLPPMGRQEVWAAGVTYYRSRSARMDESKAAGGGDFYDRVYNAERPELFFKSTPNRVAGPGQTVRIRKDSRWNVPEPELTLVVSPGGRIIGYTIGNDMSSRDIEGENPLYLPQAKVYDRSCALGPCVVAMEESLPATTEIVLEIARGEQAAFTGRTSLKALKRTPESLVEFLYRDNTFPAGCFLLTGTGIVPPDSFTLESGDEIRITIEPIGTLVNRVE